MKSTGGNDGKNRRESWKTLLPADTESNIGSLAKFYDSIPAYYEINHLPEKDFYQTLSRLKDACHELRTRSVSAASVIMQSSIRGINRKETHSKGTSTTATETPKVVEKKKRIRSKSTSSTTLRSNSPKKTSDRNVANKLSNNYQKTKGSTTQLDKMNFPKTYENFMRNKLKHFEINLKPVQKKTKNTPKEVNTNFFCSKSLDEDQLSTSNKRPQSGDIVKSTPSPPLSNHTRSSESSSNSSKRKKKTKSRNQFTFFDSNLTPTKEKTLTNMSASPVYPAARLNLAATLRAELSRKRRYNNNSCCSPRASGRNFDWEVRKTPAWKSLSQCETNKEDIMYRVATRRAEQKLLKKEYDLNMELMRQRVKAAPLLLEGTTYWSPRQSNHNCCKEFKKHSPRKFKKKSSSKENNNKTQVNQNADSDDLDSEDRAYL